MNTPLSIEQIAASLKAMEGPLGPPDSMPVELLSVRRMALTLDDRDPIHFDEEAARARGYRGVVAPWPLLWLVFFNCRDAPLVFEFGKATLHGGDAYEFHVPLIVGDTVTVSAAVTETSVKEGKSGVMGVIVTRREFRNQHGELCAVMSTTNLRR
ncbi:MAG: MaoC family dehydratase N-terminal domain-containing protein [Gammaproteobacteria bacterium]|nr:MaoC family dehydratase N-terminal domain-containing protein [Gammaproteobacteria bacterium]MBU1441922.1 MaoC family dehydratase N-terminal domain-containing protein [Gammaproteobacteria bacterium]MBU2285729.1 MaoC family dehydratase N-terminal domain-containing protein [Gammaproteobacteria bacterium]MBU2410965.1 MaoC family dehydratase N-terminal domain-containing protein [Gammaproteobacteria bacterium]